MHRFFARVHAPSTSEKLSSSRILLSELAYAFRMLQNQAICLWQLIQASLFVSLSYTSIFIQDFLFWAIPKSLLSAQSAHCGAGLWLSDCAGSGIHNVWSIWEKPFVLLEQSALKIYVFFWIRSNTAVYCGWIPEHFRHQIEPADKFSKMMTKTAALLLNWWSAETSDGAELRIMLNFWSDKYS